MKEAAGRRGFMKLVGGSVVGGFVMFGDGAQKVRAAIDPEVITPVKTAQGQMVDDVIIGTVGIPRDVQYFIEFYRRSNPSMTVLQIPLNARATFRWVPPPGEEIRLDATDRLEWRVNYGKEAEDRDDFQVVVHTRGRCLRTQNVIVNQSEFV